MQLGSSLVDIIDYLGTFAFAVSGIRMASQKNFDLFGASVVGLVTAVGGGTLRDMMLGVTPFWLTQWIYLAITLLALALFVVFHKHINKMAGTIFLFDTIGLALFTVVGFQKTLDAGFSYWAAILMGMITGSLGGVLRDILINEVPLIFRRDIYALACIAGGLFYTGCLMLQGSEVLAQLGCAATVVIVRILAVRLHWQLPILTEQNTDSEQ